MSLIHWWPLNGDTKNYGTSGEQVTESNVTYTSGKVGQSMYKGKLNFTAEQWKNTIGNTISIAMWIYTREDGTYSAGTPFFGNGGMTAPNNRKFTMFHYPAKTTLHCSWQNDDLTSSDNPNTYLSITYANFFEIGKWIHLCLVQDAKTETVTVYKNGTQYSKINVVGLATMNFKSAAAAPIRNNIDYQQINDLRIYDHALSQAEVKELSKALVIHYSFDDTLAEPTTNLITSPHNIKYVSGASDNNVSAAGLINAATTTSGTYTLSGEYNIAASDSATGPRITMLVRYEGESNWSSLGRAEVIRDGTWRTFTLTGTTNPSKTVAYCGAWLFDYSSAGSARSCYARNLQFELKDHATPYTPTSRVGMMQNETGYAAPKAVTAFQLSTVTNNGSYSGYFDGQISCIDTPVIKTSMFTEDYTLSFWVYPLDSGRAVYFGDHQISSVPTINFERTADGIFRYYHNNGSPDKSFANTEAPKETWTMLTVTYTPGTMKVYKNGALIETFSHTASVAKNINGVMRIGRDNRTGSDSGATPLYGYISDFRFYVTCLSDNDIMELYKTKAYITDKGDIETYHFIEDKTQAQVTSNYCFEVDECYEDFEVGSDYERIEYIEFSETQYIDTGLAFTDANIPITIEADIVKTSLSSNDCLAGCGNTAWSGPVMLNCHNGTCEFGVNGYATASDGSGSITANERLIIRAELGTKKEEHFWYKNGQKINLGTKAYNDRTSSSSTLYIGAFHVGTSVSIASGSCWIGHLYSFKVWYGGSSRILVPAKRKSDNAFGLYDMAEHNFYPNIGSGSLSGGPIINNSEAKIYKDQHILGRNIIEI